MRDSNPRHAACKTAVLAAELIPVENICRPTRSSDAGNMHRGAEWFSHGAQVALFHGNGKSGESDRCCPGLATLDRRRIMLLIITLVKFYGGFPEPEKKSGRTQAGLAPAHRQMVRTIGLEPT